MGKVMSREDNACESIEQTFISAVNYFQDILDNPDRPREPPKKSFEMQFIEGIINEQNNI